MLRGGNGKFSRPPITRRHARSLPRRLSPGFCIDMTLSKSRATVSEVAAAPGALAQKTFARARKPQGTRGDNRPSPRSGLTAYRCSGWIGDSRLHPDRLCPRELGRSLSRVEQLGYGGDQLGRRKRYRDKDTIGDAESSTFGSADTSHVDDRKFGIELSYFPGEIPASHAPGKPNVDDKAAIRNKLTPDEGQRLFTGKGKGKFEAARRQRVLHDALDRRLVLYDEND